jgi:hypothetical protein
MRKDGTKPDLTAFAQSMQTSDHQMDYQADAFAFASQEAHFLEWQTCDT